MSVTSESGSLAGGTTGVVFVTVHGEAGVTFVVVLLPDGTKSFCLLSVSDGVFLFTTEDVLGGGLGARRDWRAGV